MAGDGFGSYPLYPCWMCSHCDIHARTITCGKTAEQALDCEEGIQGGYPYKWNQTARQLGWTTENSTDE